MARVPTKAIPEVEVQGGPNVFQRVEGSNDPDAFGAGVGRAISGVASTIDKFAAAQQIEQDEDDRREAKEIDIRTASRLRVLFHGDGTAQNPGFANARGKDAFGQARNDIDGRANDIFEEARNSASNTNVGELLRPALGVRANSFYTNTARHAGDNRRVYDNDVDAARQKTFIDDAATDPTLTQRSLDGVEDIVAEMAQRNGWDEETAKRNLAEAQTSVVSGAVVSLLKQDKVEEAQALFDRAEGMTGSVKAGLAEMLREHGNLKAAQEAAGAVLASTEDEAEASQMINAMKLSPEATEKAQTLIRQGFAQKVRINEARMNKIESDFHGMLQSGVSLEQIQQRSPEAYFELQRDPARFARLEAAAKNAAEGLDFAKISDNETFSDLVQMPVANFIDVDLDKYKGQMTKAEYLKALTLQAAAKAKDTAIKNKTTEAVSYNNAKNVLDALAPELNIGNKDQDEVVAPMLLEMDAFITEGLGAGKPKTREEINKKAQELLLSIVGDPKPGFFNLDIFSSEENESFKTVAGALKSLSIAQQDVARIEIKNIPASTLRRVMAVLKARKIPVTDDLLEQLAAADILNQPDRIDRLLGIK